MARRSIWRVRRQAGSILFGAYWVSCRWKTTGGNRAYFARIPGGRSVDPYRSMPLARYLRTFGTGAFGSMSQRRMKENVKASSRSNADPGYDTVWARLPAGAYQDARVATVHWLRFGLRLWMKVGETGRCATTLRFVKGSVSKFKQYHCRLH